MEHKENKFELTNVVLYAKGWYERTNNIWEDLIKILELDGFSTFDKGDVYSIIVSKVQKSKLYRWTDLNMVLDGIHPKNSWKFGYYTKENVEMYTHKKNETPLPDYDMQTAFIYYVISNLRFIDNSEWCKGKPTYNENIVRPKHITKAKFENHFGENTKN